MTPPENPAQPRVGATRAYRHAGPRTRAHVAVRSATCPIAEVHRLTPHDGELLEFGCGHGLVALELARRCSGRRVTGVDIDTHKLDHARAAARALGVQDRVTFVDVAPDWAPSGRWRAVLVVDVLYLLGHDTALQVLARLARCLEPGGTIVIKEMAATPRWKARLDHTQELLATSPLGPTRGGRPDAVPAERIAATLLAEGLSVRFERLDHGRPHPHLAVVGNAARAEDRRSG